MIYFSIQEENVWNISWTPDQIKMLIHALIMTRTVRNEDTTIETNERIQHFRRVFRALFKHYPNDLGLLFQRDDGETTAFENLRETYGHKITWDLIDEINPFVNPQLPILHHVA